MVSFRSSEKFDEQSARHAVYSAVYSAIGEMGAARAGIQMKHFDEKKQEAVLACSLDSLNEVIGSLALKKTHYEKGKSFGLRLKVEKTSGKIGDFVKGAKD